MLDEDTKIKTKKKTWSLASRGFQCGGKYRHAHIVATLMRLRLYFAVTSPLEGPTLPREPGCVSVPVGSHLLFQETVDMLKSHIKEELMQGEEADSVYESMAHLSTDLLMKCSLNPGCDEELYESMATFVPAATEDLCK